MRILTTIGYLMMVMSFNAQTSVYDCSFTDATVTQAQIDASGYEFKKACILFAEDQTYDFGQSDHKKITAVTQIHIKEGFHAGPFNTGNTGIHLNLEGKSDIDVAVMNYPNLKSVQLFGKLELGLEFTPQIDNFISDFIANGQTSTNINPFDPQQIDVKAEFFVWYFNQWIGPFKSFGYTMKIIQEPLTYQHGIQTILAIPSE